MIPEPVTDPVRHSKGTTPVLPRGTENLDSRHRRTKTTFPIHRNQVWAGRKGGRPVQQQQSRRRETVDAFGPVVHDLSTLSGDIIISDEDDSVGEVQRVVRQSKPRPKGKPKKERSEWYGAERELDHDRAITNRLQTLRLLKQEGFQLKEVFATKTEATAWMNEHVATTSGVEEDSEVDSEGLEFANGKKKRIVREADKSAEVIPSVPADRIVIHMAPPLPLSNKITLNSADFFRAETAGADPSIGNKEHIYGIPFDNVDEMDIALCPPHMTTIERESFLETVVDVTALPGMFRQNEGGKRQWTRTRLLP